MSEYTTSARTRLALIHAAGELAAEQGVEGLSMRAIAEHAGENAGSIHYHFGGKEGLVEEMLRYAMKGWSEDPLPAYIASLDDDLDCVDVQVAAIRGVVRRLVALLFESGRPRWCSQVFYQVLQHAGPLRQLLRREVMDPELDAISELFMRIRPQLSAMKALQWTLHLTSSLILHADYGDIILERLGTTSFPDGYFASLERRIVRDSLWALGLPLPEDLINE
ncbi:MAG: TetR/AcrR family transcriptional regulator [Lentisphaeria bacterium]|nr:TetR/AcrR family transcriptional regulator [Lentisphaeria bacterium]